MHTARAHLEALLAKGDLLHAIRDLKLLTGMGLAEAQGAMQAAQAGDWSPALLAALPSWGDTAAQRALREELWPALAALGEPRALFFAEKDFRDGLLVLIGEALHFARRGLRGPELEALGSLPELESLALRATLSGVELTLRGGAREHRLRRIPERDQATLERLRARVVASGVGAGRPVVAPPEPEVEPSPEPEAEPEPAAPPTPARARQSGPGAPKPREALDQAPEPPKEPELPEAPKRLVGPVEPPPLMDFPGAHGQLMRLVGVCFAVALVEHLIWRYAPWRDPNSKALLTWLLAAAAGLRLMPDAKGKGWVYGGALAATVTAQVLVTLGAWRFMVMAWPILGAFWLRGQGRRSWPGEAGALGAAVVLAMTALDQLWLILAAPSVVFVFSDLFVFWGLHLVWEQRHRARERRSAA